jgi:hypothetical protein
MLNIELVLNILKSSTYQSLNDKIIVQRVIELLELEKEFCICAAIKTDSGTIFPCRRHHQGLHLVHVTSSETITDGKNAQGFLTSNNRFVGREEAYKLQIAAGIESKSHDGYHGELLFSEDLY